MMTAQASTRMPERSKLRLPRVSAAPLHRVGAACTSVPNSTLATPSMKNDSAKVKKKVTTMPSIGRLPSCARRSTTWS